MNKRIGKILITLLSLCLLTVTLTLFTSCKNKLDEPVNLRLVETSQTLMWNRVPGARGYAALISGDEREKTLRTNSISLEYLMPGEYTVQIKALGDGEEVKDSEWVSFKYTREAESGLNYKAIKNNTEYQLVGLGTATGDVVIEDVYRGRPVTSIADKAFAGSIDVTSVTIGKNVKTIGKSAFVRCSELTSVKFAEGSALTSIGEYAFQSCKKLTEITFPDGVKVVPSYIFSWCENLKTVTFGAATEEISGYAFSSCAALEKISLPESMKTIGEYAFADCVALSTLSFGKSIEVIGDCAFYNCENLPEAPIGDKLQSLGQFAFGNCKKITKADIPDTCQTIGNYAFGSCEALESVSFGEGLRTVGAGVFLNTKFIDEYEGDIVFVDGWIIEAKNREIEELTLPEGTYGIATSAFQSCKNLRNIDIVGVKYLNEFSFAVCENLQVALFDDSLLAIDGYTFYGCKLLRKLYLGNRLETIGDYAFAQCERLDDKPEAITLPHSLVSIGSSAFYKTAAFNQTDMGVVYIGDWAVDCRDLGMFAYSEIIFKEGTRGIANYCCDKLKVMNYVYMPTSVERIGRGAFYGLGVVKVIYLPQNLKYIGDYAFYGCSGAMFGEFGHLSIPTRTEYIGRSAFYNCTMIVGVTVPGSVKTIGDFAFYGCENIGLTVSNTDQTQFYKGEVILGDGLESIGEKAFASCINLTGIDIPDSVKRIGAKAFYKCEKLASLKLGNGITEISDFCFYNCAALESIVIPDSVTRIGKYAFRGCAAATELSLGKNLKEIGGYAFYACAAVNNVVLPESIQKIGDYTFRGCASVCSVIIPDVELEIGKHAFYGLSRAAIYCEDDAPGNEWHERFNSSYRPIYYGVKLSEDKSYVVSFVKTETNPQNVSRADVIAAPVRAGYEFLGFATSPDATSAQYTMKTVTEAANGTTVYAVWSASADLPATE